MTDMPRDGDVERLEYLKNRHAEHAMPVHCSTCFLLAEIAKLQAVEKAARALRDRHAELEAGEGDRLLAGMSLAALILAVDALDAALREAQAEIERLQVVEKAARALRDRHAELEAGEGDRLLADMSLAALILAVDALDAALREAQAKIERLQVVVEDYQA